MYIISPVIFLFFIFLDKLISLSINGDDDDARQYIESHDICGNDLELESESEIDNENTEVFKNQYNITSEFFLHINYFVYLGKTNKKTSSQKNYERRFVRTKKKRITQTSSIISCYGHIN